LGRGSNAYFIRGLGFITLYKQGKETRETAVKLLVGLEAEEAAWTLKVIGGHRERNTKQ
jgi:hypothetical protein